MSATQNRNLTTIKFNTGSLLPGRIVKTATFTRGIRAHFVKMDIPVGLEGYCNLQYRIKEVDNTNKVLTLTYKISTTQYADIEWPMSALNENFGIKL